MNGLVLESRSVRMQRAIRELPPRTRMVLILARWDGLSANEIAIRLAITPTAVRRLLWRALEYIAEVTAFRLIDCGPVCGLRWWRR